MMGLLDFLRRKGPRRAPRQQAGAVGEKAAMAWLKRRGYRLLARNVTCREGEVDLVAEERRTGTLCFVEVRSRTLPADARPTVEPEETVTLRKRRRVVAAARRFLARRRGPAAAIRFDVVTVRLPASGGRPDVRHYPGAFDAAGGLL